MYPYPCIYTYLTLFIQIYLLVCVLNSYECLQICIIILSSCLSVTFPSVNKKSDSYHTLSIFLTAPFYCTCVWISKLLTYNSTETDIIKLVHYLCSIPFIFSFPDSTHFQSCSDPHFCPHPLQ